MATAIKAIPTLKGSEAKRFREQAEKVENAIENGVADEENPLCVLAKKILQKAGML